MMAESWADEYFRMIEDCEKRESRLSEWERNFIESIRERLAAEKLLTQKQTETLERIWEQATKQGFGSLQFIGVTDA